MNLESLTAQLANRVNQPHVIELYLKKVANAYYKLGQKDALKNSRLDVVSDIEEDEDTEFCPKCNSADIYCEGGEFNEWHCEGCGKCFSEPNVK